MSRKDTWLLRLFDFIFWAFLIATILHVVFLVFVPTPTEWPGEFPYENVNPGKSEFWAPFLRHLSLFSQHFSIIGFVDILNGAFLTMFVYKMGNDVKDAIRRGDGSTKGRRKGKEKDDGKLKPSTYVEWAMGALVSGIIFASSRLAITEIHRAYLYLVAIFVFSFVSYYFLYRLRRKLMLAEKKDEKAETQSISEHC